MQGKNNGIFPTPKGSQQVAYLRPDHISQVISNWKLRFSGHASKSVNVFVYRMEALTMQTLDGNFELISRYASNLFEGSASEWFWRFHKTVPIVTWTQLSSALHTGSCCMGRAAKNTSS